MQQNFLGRISICIAGTLLFSPLDSQSQSDLPSSKRVVGNAAARKMAAWTIDSRPIITLDEKSGEEFLDVVAVSRLPNGSLAVAALTTNNIRLFRPDGSLMRTIGRTGRGPAEFQGLVDLLLKRDTLVGVDASGVAHLFDVDGNYKRSESRPFLPAALASRRIGYFPGGQLVVQSAPPRESYINGSSARQLFSLWQIDSKKAQDANIIAKYPAFEIKENKSGRFASVKFGSRGHAVVLDWGFCTGYSGTFAISCFDLKGAPRFSAKRPDQRAKPVTGAMKDAFFLDDSLANPSASSASYRESVRTNTLFAQTLPFFGRLLASRSGEVWVGPMTPAEEGARVSPSPSQPTVWTVLSGDGQWLAELTLPTRFRLMEAGRDYVAGVVTNAADEESVVLYRIRR